jgi:iron-sulfur cluster assembly protein
MIITEKASNRIKILKQENNLDSSYFLRVSVQGGGCSGLSYKLDFDSEIKSFLSTSNF